MQLLTLQQRAARRHAANITHPHQACSRGHCWQLGAQALCAVPCCDVLCRFTVLYFVHALYWRDGFRFMGSVWGSNSCGRRFLGEVLQGLFIVWGLAVLTIAWCIGVTRFRDNRHNIDDILVSQLTGPNHTLAASRCSADGGRQWCWIAAAVWWPTDSSACGLWTLRAVGSPVASEAFFDGVAGAG